MLQIIMQQCLPKSAHDWIELLFDFVFYCSLTV